MKSLAWVFLIASSLMLFPSSLFASLESRDLQRHAVMTEQAALLSQVDTISLYLSSSRVALAPRLTSQKVVEVEMTVLDGNLIANKVAMMDYVSRLIRTFIATLLERLPVYAPTVAKSFNPQTDIVFRVNEGTQRKPVVIWNGVAWQWQDRQAESDYQRGLRASSSAPAGSTLPPPVAAQTSAEQAGSIQRADLNEVRALEPGRKGCGCPARKR